VTFVIDPVPSKRLLTKEGQIGWHGTLVRPNGVSILSKTERKGKLESLGRVD